MVTKKAIPEHDVKDLMTWELSDLVNEILLIADISRDELKRIDRLHEALTERIAELDDVHSMLHDHYIALQKVRCDMRYMHRKTIKDTSKLDETRNFAIVIDIVELVLWEIETICPSVDSNEYKEDWPF